MAKTKSITDRPMIIVSLTVSKWGVEYLKELQNGHWVKTEQLVTVNPDKSSNNDITVGKIVKVKDETAKTGSFSIRVNRWYSDVVLPNGEIKRAWECKNDNINYSYPSLEACFKVLRQHPNILNTHRNDVIIERRMETYFNSKTKEIVKDRKVAESWFKGQNPLFISTSQYQQIGVWVNGGKDYIDISYYYSNRLQREGCEPWKKAKVAGFRLYNDGTISHFYKGKLYDRDREFCTTRMKYRTLDVRFVESYRLSTLCLDLRSPELIGSSSSVTQLCPETLKLLEKAGFPKTYWCWNNNRRPFVDTYDLVNFATHIQDKNPTKRGTSIAEFLADKPFGPGCENVLEFNKGVLIRVPGYLETWDCNGKIFNHKPRPYEGGSDTNSKLLKAEIYERYRIWISNNGKTRSCQENIHDGTLWSQCRWDNLVWNDSFKEEWSFEKASTVEAQKIQKVAIAEYNKIAKATYSKVFKIMPLLTRLEEFLGRHKELTKAEGIKALLDAIYYAPKLTETLIKIGYENWFYESTGYRYSGCSGTEERFSIEKVLRRFGINSMNDYKEKSSNSMYKNLGITKQQFMWMISYESSPQFMQIFRDIAIRIPGKNNEVYSQFADIPVKYLQVMATAADRLIESIPSSIYRDQNYYANAYWDAAQKLRRLMQSYSFTPVDLEKAVTRKLDLTMLEDYLRLRNRCDGHDNFRATDWDKIPADQTDLRFSHDRLTEFYNLLMAEQERYYRQEEEKRLIACQEKYDARYKKLKKLAYVKDDEDQVIVVPEKLIELVVEGQTLHHCVGSFTQSVSEGRDTIVFLRSKNTPTVPYATIALLQRGDRWVVDQAHTAHNGPITAKDVAFLKRWGAQNNVDLSSISERYGAKCHH